MIPAVTSTSAASTSTAAARHASADDAVATATAAAASASASTRTSAPEGQTATVTISEQASVQAAVQSAVKPDWTYQAADGNKDGKVTVFEQQVYDFRHYPSSLEKAKAYGEAADEPKPDAGLTA